MKNILIINGHPVQDSYSAALAKAYHEGARTNSDQVTTITVRELDFNPNLEHGYKKRMEMEPDIKSSIEKIQQADHIVWVFPVWWAGVPALLKGFIDRTFLPDVAFKSRDGKLPQKLLKGKTARIIVTSDTPRWYDYLIMGSPTLNQFKKGVLGFSGISPVQVSYISPIKNAPEKSLNKWVNKITELGRKGA